MAATKSSGNDLKTVRDTLESIWVAIVLAFVLRAFVVEAFVIPTGSMAPRLMGQHYELQCPACGYDFAFDGNTRNPPSSARCPTCGYSGDGFVRSGGAVSDGGDRVLVLKYLYDFQPPRRWDVVVFVNPQDNRENYIKRLIGLPGETIEIVHGDIFVSKNGKGGPFEIQQKTPRAQEAMWQVIFDNDYQPDTTSGRFSFRMAPPKWEPADGAWKMGEWGRQFNLESGRGTLDFVADRSVFLPQYGYNVGTRCNEETDVCTDLKLSMVWTPQSPEARLTLQLTSFDNMFFGDVSADGACKLRIGKGKKKNPDPDGKMAPTGIRDLQESLPPFQAGKAYRIALTHDDLEATLWVDDRPVLRSTRNEYEVTYRQLKDLMNKGPVSPPQVRIFADGKLQLSHVQLMRDVYYTSPPIDEVKDGPYGEVARVIRAKGGSAPGWGTTGHPITLVGDEQPDRDLDEFFVLGDNSPMSLDGRCWINAAPTLRLWKDPDKHRAAIEAGVNDADNLLYHPGTVPRYSMKGKAMFVYWPAGFRAFGNGGWPIIPNVGRMRLIR